MRTTPETLLIIGGVAGGASAAARARRHSETAHIILLERGPDVSFANCGLPYHIGGEIPDRAELALQTPESLRTLLNLDVRTLTEATAIDRANKQVRVRSLTDNSGSVISYDKLILAPGASPLRPPLPGIESPQVLTLRNLQDMDRIKAAAAAVDHVAIIGAGFIGLEMAEQLHHIGKQVSVIELQPQVLPQLDAEMVRPLENSLRWHRWLRSLI
jgi:NADPH-dependent 2,4-dienoyl-CoA reductase/sulfur reductase-like enzyme